MSEQDAAEVWDHDGPWTRNEMAAAIERVRISRLDLEEFGTEGYWLPGLVSFAILEKSLSGGPKAE